MNDQYPIIRLPGSESWASGYDLGRVLDERFPGRDAIDFAYAGTYNGWGPLETEGVGITELWMLKQGYNDGTDWKWQVVLTNGETWIAEGGCDYTGWDCQSDLRWEQA